MNHFDVEQLFSKFDDDSFALGIFLWIFLNFLVSIWRQI